jgi:ABC-type multidrug transport system fused ATPase/permease subunit
MSKDSIINAANVSNSIEFIEKLDAKFDSEIGEDGVTLSGGQRQRLSIARAIAKDSPILILDEATSALDSATEKLVQSAIKNIHKDRTKIIIAHRLSTIQDADRIIVLKDGQIIDKGSLVALDTTQKLLDRIQTKKITFHVSKAPEVKKLALSGVQFNSDVSNTITAVF